MLLFYIDYLVDKNQIFKTVYDIYETLVEKWLVREADKRKHTTSGREQFKKELYTYSRLVALEIYKQRKVNDLLSLSKDMAIEVAHNSQLDLRDYEVTGQSLLTRDAESNWKFAHKSIWEFFIAKEALGNRDGWQKQNFDGMEMARKFILEKCLDFFIPPDFIFIKGGIFWMGSPANEAERSDNETQHQVKLNNFYMAKYPVTVEQYEAFVSETNYQHPGKGMGDENKQHPVVEISWDDASAYCEWFGKKEKISCRLPTEAEWEYACRAGTTTPFNTSENLTTDQANYNGNRPYKNHPKGKYIGTTTPVGIYPPNAWGLYDMHGNVWESCLDWYGQKYYNKCKRQGVVENLRGPKSGSNRVLRGGSWGDIAGALSFRLP